MLLPLLSRHLPLVAPECRLLTPSVLCVCWSVVHLLAELYPRYGHELEQQMKQEAVAAATPRFTRSRLTHQRA
jgi:hypothetical protein